MLVLLDCDGTLFVGEDPLVLKSMIEALNRMTGADLEPSAVDELDHEARCARWLARELIRRHGLPPVDLGRWVELVQQLYLAEVDGDDGRRWRAPAGTATALQTLAEDGFSLALLTGVPEQIARFRFDRLGLARWLPRGQGAFGSEVEERDDLLLLALRRAGRPPSEAVAVGDTSRDVTSAKALGLHAVAVVFDGGPPAAAPQADGVVRTMPELVETLRRIRADLE